MKGRSKTGNTIVKRQIKSKPDAIKFPQRSVSFSDRPLGAYISCYSWKRDSEGQNIDADFIKYLECLG